MGFKGELTIRGFNEEGYLPFESLEKDALCPPLPSIEKLPHSFIEVFKTVQRVNPNVKRLRLQAFSPTRENNHLGIILSVFGTIDEKHNECRIITVDILTLRGQSSPALC